MNIRVLVIDDEESIRYTFKSFLEEEGYVVDTAENFDEFEEKISKSIFDVVFADIILGGKSGIDILKTIRNKDPQCPVVMITGAPDIKTASEAVRLGAFDYLFKPINQETLLHTTRLAVQFKRLNEEKETYRLTLDTIFRSVKDAMITVSNDMVILEINKSAEDLCRVSRDIIGKPIDAFGGGCNEYCLNALRETVRKQKPVELYRIECKKENGQVRVVSITTAQLIVSKNTTAGAVLVIRDETALANLEKEMKERHKFHKIIGKSREMQEIYSVIESLTDVQTTVLITGESGTGKELIADAIHYLGNRSDKPLIKVNCSALSENLLESEMFGHVRGAFTGAERDKVGRFQKADGGTIFLDEIGNISEKMQLQLLRVLQEKTFEKVGDSTPIKVDVRIIAATNQDLKKKVKQGVFREDLYYRLKVMELEIPPLRAKRQDIPLLVDYFTKELNRKLDKDIHYVSENVKEVFMNYDWPGNVRELEHALEHAFVLCNDKIITVRHLPAEIRDFAGSSISPAITSENDDYQSILQALEKTGGNKSKAARLLGISVRTLYRKLEKQQG
jgi:DNA-binding NtrC family response regulator